jgi:hypothetical protein
MRSVTSCRLDDCGSNPSRAGIFLIATMSGAHPVICSMCVCGSLLFGIKLSEHDVEHLPSFSANIKNEIFTSAPSLCLHGMLLG